MGLSGDRRTAMSETYRVLGEHGMPLPAFLWFNKPSSSQ